MRTPLLQASEGGESKRRPWNPGAVELPGLVPLRVSPE